MTITDWLAQAATAAGTVGGAASSYVLKRFREAEKNAKDAIKIAKTVRESLSESKKDFLALQQGLRLELTAFKTEVTDRLDRHLRAQVMQSRPEIAHDMRELVSLRDEIERLEKRVDELKSDLVRERGQRHALQRELQDDAREDGKQWQTTHRTLATLETKVEILMIQSRSPK